MSFDLASEQINQRLNSMPLTRTIEPGIFDNFGYGAGMATMRTFAAGASGLHLLGAVAPIVQDLTQNFLFGTGKTTNQDRFFAEHDALFKRSVDYWTPRPGEVGVAGEITGALLGTLPMVIANPAAGVAQFQMSQAESFVNAGAGSARANIAAIGMGAGFGLGVWMPILGQNLWQRMLVGGAGANVAQGVLTRGFAGQLLEGHVQEGAAPTAFNLMDITTDALLGLAFGSLAHVSPAQRAQGARAWTQIRNWAGSFTPQEVDALAVLRLGQHKNADSAPGIPQTPADLEAHVERMNESLRALVNDQPVDVQSIGREQGAAPVDNSAIPTDETAPSVQDIHRLAESRGIAWDNDPAFMALTEEITGKRHLDDLDATERTELARHISGEVASAGPPQALQEPPTFDPRPDRERDATAIVANLRAAADDIARDYGLEPPARPVEEHPVYRAVKEQLDKLERVTGEQADAYARLHTAFYDAMAKRTGRTVDDLLATHPVRISRETPEGTALAQTGSPAFKRWFGDSKVVDRQGKPVVVYHGTGADFDVFRTTGALRPGYGDGAHFAESAGLAGWYAEQWSDGNRGTGDTIMPVYLSIKNPFTGNFYTWGFERGLTNAKAITEALKKEGYDGIRYAHPDMTLDSKPGVAWVAFEPTQIKSAIGNRGTFDPASPNILHQDAHPVFYSLLERLLGQAKMEQAPAKGWKDFIRGLTQKGVKPDEVKWSGIEEWLDAQGGKVTKAQVLDFLKHGGVRVEEVMAGGPNAIQARSPDDAAIQANIDQLSNLGYGLIEPDGMPDGVLFHDRETGETKDWIDIERDAQAARDDGRIEEADKMLDASILAREVQNYLSEGTGNHADISVTKFGQYQLPGGQNYRELLLTLPNTGGRLLYRAEDMTATVTSNGKWMVKSNDGRHTTAIPRNVAETEGIAREIAASMFNQSDSDRAGNAFHSSHFDTPNILAHIRFNERVDADGKRVLFVEEFQSDWAQQGKKKGFSEPRQEKEWIVRLKDGGSVYRRFGEAYENEARQFEAAHPEMEVVEGQRTVIPDGVPAAPFVGKTDQWVALAVKRVIRYAAEHGFERVAWTTGAQQVERYSSALRKAVDSIEWEKTPEGIHIVGFKGKREDASKPLEFAQVDTYQDDPVYRSTDTRYYVSHNRDFPWKWDGPGGTSNGGFRTAEEAMADAQRHAKTLQRPGIEPQKVVDTRQREDELSDAIGKSMAERIINDPNQKGTIEGEAINISDTGMAGFYDRIVPKVVKEVLRQLDKTARVGEVAFPGRFQVKEIDGVWVAVDEGGSGEQFKTRQEAETWAAENNRTEAGGQNVGKQTGFEITPEMRTAAMKGQSLFQDSAGGPRGYMATDAEGRRTIGLLEGADPSTMIHESAHFFLDTMVDLAADRAAPAELKADMARIMEWFGVKPEDWAGMDLEARRSYHEQFARGFELFTAEGKPPTPELAGIFQRFKDWLIQVYRSLTELNVKLSDPVREVFNRMLSGERAPDVPRDFTDPDVRHLVRGMVENETGWAQIGGKLDIGRLVREHGPDAIDAQGRPTISGVAFTEWIPKAEWWRDRPDKKLTEEGYRKALQKAEAGEKLRPIEQRAIDFLTKMANERMAEVAKLGEDEWVFTARDLLAEEELPSTANVVDSDQVARAMAIDEAGVERAALRFENDDAAFMAEVRRINETGQAAEGGQKDTGQAPGGRERAEEQDTGPGPEPAGDGSEPASALSAAADDFVRKRPGLPLRVGTNADGTPVTMTAQEYLDAARAAHQQAMQDAPLFEAAAQCLLGES